MACRLGIQIRWSAYSTWLTKPFIRAMETGSPCWLEKRSAASCVRLAFLPGSKRSSSVTIQVALGKTSFHSLNGRLVVRMTGLRS
jgi:hypothetical protein